MSAEKNEPVGWVKKQTLTRLQDFDGIIYATGGFDDAVPLYTQPQRQPLTDEEIRELSQQHKFAERMEKFVRIVERAHGIGGEYER